MVFTRTTGLSVALLAWAAGCFPRLPVAVDGRAVDTGGSPDGGDGGAADGGAADSGQDSVKLTAVEPADGPTGGGLEVTLRGGPFDPDTAAAWFGGQAATVLDVRDDSLVVELPPNAAGTVAVEVASGGATASLPDAFTYWEDAGGLATALATWIYYRPAYPSYWGEDDALMVSTWAAFIEPADAWPADLYARERNSCEPSASAPALTAVTTGPDQVEMWAAGHSVALPKGGSGTYSDLSGVTWSYAPDEDVGFAAAASAAAPALEFDAVARTPPTLEIDDPPMATDATPSVSRDAVVFRWTPVGADYLRFVVTDDNGDTVAICYADDDGDFQIPSSYFESLEYSIVYEGDGWLDWHYEAIVFVTVVAFDEDETVLDHDDGLLRAQAGFGVYGTVGIEYF